MTDTLTATTTVVDATQPWTTESVAALIGRRERMSHGGHGRVIDAVLLDNGTCEVTYGMPWGPVPSEDAYTETYGSDDE